MDRASPRRSPARAALPLVLAMAAAIPNAARAQAPALNEKVAEFARAQRGKKVGDGSCLTLAVEALRHAGAARVPLDRPDGDYVWGRRIDRLEDVLPGDILQFRDAVFRGRKQLTKRRWISWHHAYPHHTAVVSSVAEGGKVLTVLHQNVGPEGTDEATRKTVQETSLRMDSLQEGGWVRIYRPVGPGEAGRRRGADDEGGRSP